MRVRTALACSTILATSGLLFTGCSQSTLNSQLPGVTPAVQSHRSGGFMSPDITNDGAQLVYLTAFVAGKVYIYDQQGSGQAPIGEIDGLSAPSGITVTPAGDIYVASQSNGTVTAFHKGLLSPFKTFTGGQSLTGVAVDANGTVYANNGFSNQIYEWAHGSSKLTRTLKAGFTDNCDYVALDANGNLFVDSLFGEFEEFTAGSKTPIKLFQSSQYTAPEGLAFDANANLVTVWSGGGVTIYPPPYNGTTLGAFKYTGLMYDIALSKNNKFLWGGNMTGSNGTVGQAYSYPRGKLRKTTSSANISGDAILGIATTP